MLLINVQENLVALAFQGVQRRRLYWVNFIVNLREICLRPSGLQEDLVNFQQLFI